MSRTPLTLGCPPRHSRRVPIISYRCFNGQTAFLPTPNHSFLRKRIRPNCACPSYAAGNYGPRQIALGARQRLGGGRDGCQAATVPDQMWASLTDCYENGVTRRGNSANRPDNQCHSAKETVPAFFGTTQSLARPQTRTRPGRIRGHWLRRIGSNSSLANKAFAWCRPRSVTCGG